MSAKRCCGFCENLPALPRHRAGKPSRCPVCKQELWIGPAQTYRLVDGERRGPRRGPVAVGLCLAIAVLLVLGAMFFRRSEQPAIATAQRPLPAPVVSRESAPSSSTPEVAHVRAHARATVKPSRYHVPVSVKPPGEPLRAKLQPHARGWNKEAPGPLMAAEDLPRAKRAIALPRWAQTPSKWTLQLSLEEQLASVPQVDLDPDYMKRSKAHLQEFAKLIGEKTKKDRDAFVRGLMKERPDLAGLPFLLGKDCQLSVSDARQLEMSSTNVRRSLSQAQVDTIERNYRSSAPESHYRSDVDPIARRFWQGFSAKSEVNNHLATLAQTTLAENASFRLLFTEHLDEVAHEKRVALLTQRALFDLDERVRTTALKGLQASANEHAPKLLEGLRYPWAPVTRHAAEAIAALRLTNTVSQLVAMLDQHDPDAPFEVTDKQGRSKMMVRELVRINHHRNCLLCHAPAFQTTRRGLPQDNRNDAELVRALVPVPNSPMPPSFSPLYYNTKPGDIIVRADITYLRQDFSLMQTVPDPGKWRSEQRFDFFIRTRELTGEEAAAARRYIPPATSEYKDTIVWALRELTGVDAPPTAAAWRAVLAKQASAK